MKSNVITLRPRTLENIEPPPDRPFDEVPAQRREAIKLHLETWTAPILSDAIVDTAGQIFLAQDGHELMPFYVWLTMWLQRG